MARIERAHGSPAANPAFWRNASPLPFLGRVTEPLLIHHGTADDTCPIAWSQQAAAAFEAAGKDVELLTYAGEGHAFGPQWPASMRRTVAFFACSCAEVCRTVVRMLCRLRPFPDAP